MLAPPVAPILVVSTNLCKRTLITCLARSSRYTEPLNPHNLLKSTSTASPRTTSLPPLEKGEVLSPEKIRATTGGIAFLPHQLFSKPHYPSPRTITLASLVKGRWIDGKAQALILLLSVYDTPTFFIYQTFLPSRRRDCHSTNPPKTALSLAPHPYPCLPSKKGEVLLLGQAEPTMVGIAPHPHHQ